MPGVGAGGEAGDLFVAFVGEFLGKIDHVYTVSGFDRDLHRGWDQPSTLRVTSARIRSGSVANSVRAAAAFDSLTTMVAFWPAAKCFLISTTLLGLFGTIVLVAIVIR